MKEIVITSRQMQSIYNYWITEVFDKHTSNLSFSEWIKEDGGIEIGSLPILLFQLRRAKIIDNQKAMFFILKTSG